MLRRPLRSRSFGALGRAGSVAVLALAAGAATAACGSSSPSASVTGSASRSGSCAGVPGAHHARLVVEPATGTVVQRCVGFAGSKIPALTLLADSHVQAGTQKFSFGMAICQVDHVPAHYAQCLPTSGDYWAVFLSADGHRWTSPSSGVSDITVPAGGSLGLRYDPQQGTPAPPPSPSPA